MRPASFLTLAAASGLAVVAAATTASAANVDGGDASASLTFSALTGPLPLYPGEVTNTMHRLDIPSGPIAISEFSAEVVEKDPLTGDIVPVPLAEAYLHHHVVFSEHQFYDDPKVGQSPMVPSGAGASRGVGFGAGTESRGTKQKFPYPYRFTTVEGEDEFIANVHVINTRTLSEEEAHHCLECPCTAEDRVDGLESTSLLESVIERKGDWDRCNADLMEEENTSCFPDKYHGGLYCCEHGDFCLDDYFMTDEEKAAQSGRGAQSVFYLRYTLTYAPPTPAVKPLYLAACCDATGDNARKGNTEYDIPKCDDGDGDCVHVLETVQSLHGASKRSYGAGDERDEYVDVVYMVGHLHRGGLSVSAYLADGSPLCESYPTYGTGAPGEIGDEPGYINAMSSCTFDPPRRMRTTDKIHVVGRYDASEAHTGVMSLFYIAVADIPADTNASAEAGPLRAAAVGQEALGAPRGGGSRARLVSFVALVAMVGAVGAVYHVAARSYRRWNYEPLPNGSDISA